MIDKKDVIETGVVVSTSLVPNKNKNYGTRSRSVHIINDNTLTNVSILFSE